MNRSRLALLITLFTAIASQAAPKRNVEIIRDDWGIAHVFGKTDADAVYGMVYAQCEDDFNRVEHNYLLSLGRLAEAEGENEIYRDLRMKLFIDPADMKAKYGQSPQWLKALMDAWADGINHYLATHPDVKPKVITHFEPWMALSFTEGSIGGDIETISLERLRAFYEKTPSTPIARLSFVDAESGSNGIAIAPKLTTSHHAMLLINPHTSHYFRSELQMVSEEGLDAYGAVTWGQIFIYQGFNPHAGWMHTSSGVDNIDEFAETITKKGNGYVYKYGSEERPVRTKTITVPYKSATGMASKTFTAYFTKHGPVVREADGKWITVSLMQDPVHALIQSYSRTKARSYKEYVKIMELHTNSSNNTLFATSDGDIAYFHSNFIPRRDAKFDYTKPVDGSDPATDWNGVLSFQHTPNVINPPNGWVYNSNNWPWSAAGPYSPKRADYPKYVERGSEETPRGYHALRVLTDQKDFTLQKLIDAAFDSYLPAFDALLPPLLKDYDDLPASDPLKSQLAEPIEMLRKWDRRWSASSVPTSLAIFWAEQRGQNRLQSLVAAMQKLERDFGSWKTAWGDINRFQRFHDDIEPHFDDTKPSIPVPFTSARWGSLASFAAKPYPNTKKWYGTSGNSFVAVIEFGPRIHARAITAGGESGDPASPHFNDQASRFASGDLREVYFYREQLKDHTERKYRP
jgi:acyl-homoserine-lactone acylase